MKTLLLSLTLFIFSFTANAQVAAQLTIGGKYNENATSVVQTKDRGYIMTGATVTYSIGNGYSVYVMKLDSAFNLKWTESIGGTTGTGYDVGSCIIQTKDDGYAIGGYANSAGAGGYDVYVVKLDSIGNVKWTTTFGGTGDDRAYSIVQTYDKGYAVTGYTISYGGHVYVIKLDSNGNVKWNKTIGGTGGDYGYSIIETYDKGLAITGYTGSYGAGSDDVYVIKLDSAGNLKWTKTIGGSGGDVGEAIVQTYDKGLAIAGSTASFGAGKHNMYVIKLDSAGNLKWTRTIGGTSYDYGYALTQANDKGLVIAGSTMSFGAGSNDVYIAKLDSLGNLLWTKTYGGFSDEFAASIIQAKDKGYAVAGWTDTYGAGQDDVYFLKLDSNGNTCSGGTGGTASSGGTVSSGGSVGSGGSASSGGTVSGGGTYNSLCVTTALNNEQPVKENVSLYPNPSNGKFTVRAEKQSGETMIEIYNVLGESVYTGSLTSLSTQIDLSNKPSGIYLYRIVSEKGDLVSEGKMIIE